MNPIGQTARVLTLLQVRYSFVFLTVGATALTRYSGATSGKTRLVLRSSHVREQGPGPHHIVAALTDPVFGLPMHLTRFRGDTDERYGRDQQFVLKDSGNSALLDLRATAEPPLSGLGPDVWQSILRRLPTSGFTANLSPSLLAGLSSLGAA